MLLRYRDSRLESVIEVLAVVAKVAADVVAAEAVSERRVLVVVKLIHDMHQSL